MRRNEKGNAGVIIAVLITIVVINLLVFLWEYNTIAPWLPGTHNDWLAGLLHGYFAVGNFIVNLVNGQAQASLYAAGGSGWYNFWYLFGIGALIGGCSSGSSRRN